MSFIAAIVSPLLGILGACVGVAVFFSSRSLLTALPVALDMFLAAGLLRLSVSSEWHYVVVVLLVMVIRRLATWSLHRAENKRAYAKLFPHITSQRANT